MSDALEIIEMARKTGKIRKGCNEVTKLIEKGEAKFVAIAKDVQPKEIVMHIPLLAKEKGIKFAEVDRKQELGAAAGIPLGTSAVAVIEEGNAKELIKHFNSE
jgi:large subunit ribosomal protein L7Ae